MKKILSAILTVAMLATTVTCFPAAAADAAASADKSTVSYAKLGETVDAYGCKVWQADKNTPAVQYQNGDAGWYLDPALGNANRWICVDVDDKLAKDLGPGENLELTVTYFDSSNGKLTLEYPKLQTNNPGVDKTNWSTKKNVGFVQEEREQLKSSGIWKKATWILERPTMNNELNNADFRVGIYTDKMGFLQNGAVLVSKIELKRTNTYSKLDITVGSDNFGNIFWTDQDIKLNVDIDTSIEPYAQTAKNEGEFEADVICSLYDRYGSLYRTKTQKAAVVPNQNTKVEFCFDDVTDYGLYDVKAEVVNKDKKIYSSAKGKTSYAISTFGKIRNPKGGINSGNRTDLEEVFEVIYNAGYTWIAEASNIATIARRTYENGLLKTEVTPNTGLLECLNTAKKWDLKVALFCMGQRGSSVSNSFLLDKDAPTPLEQYPVTDKASKEFAKIYVQLAEQIGDSVDLMMIGNEVDIAPVSGEDYWATATAKTMEYAYTMLKEKYPDTIVAGPQQLTIGNSREKWLEKYLAAGGYKWMDVFSYHPYLQAYSPIYSDMWNSMVMGGNLRESVELLKKYGIEDIPIVASEYGYSSLYYVCDTPLKQAAWDVQQYMIMQQEDYLDVACLFQISDSNYGKAGVTKENGFGILNGVNERDDALYYGTAKESLLATSNQNIQMADTKYVKRMDLDDKQTIAYQWKKQQTGEDMLTIFTDLDNVLHTFDLGTNEITVVDMYGNEKVLTSPDGKYTFSVTMEPLYIKGSFKKVIHLENGGIRPAQAIASAALGGSFDINITDPKNKITDVKLETIDDTSVAEYSFDGKKIVVKSNGKTEMEYEPLRVILYTKDGATFDGNVMVTYSNPVTMENQISKNTNGNWEIKTTLTNSSMDTAITGEIEIMAPSTWKGGMKPESVTVNPGETKVVYLTLDERLVEHSGDIVTVGFVTDKETLAGVYNSTKLDFLYAAKAPDDFKLDGDLSDWANTGWIKADRTDMFTTVVGFANEYTGLSDISGELAVMFDEENLYFGGRVYDDIHYCESTTADRMWAMDSLQFGYIYDPDDEQQASIFEEICVGLLEGKPTIYRHKTISGATAPEINGAEAQIKREGTTTYYEIKIPIKSITNNVEEFKAGNTFKFGALINENDGPGRKGYYKIGDGISDSKSSAQFLKMFLQEQ